ncbi:hypothetical protein [Naasia lichenicola]|uniref:Uncharacterized protein n=1 Tax=Naasia lichenicola TaxID=2565933 RepID=A0A4S4FF99_9MICO|nr:hypothetical protein [Naasia lichenicola]THG28658.1 hypothetical protein E6C64_17860 [Naasia lichenicola]
MRRFLVLYGTVGLVYLVLGGVSMIVEGPDVLGFVFLALGAFWLFLVVRFLLRSRSALEIGPGDERTDLRGAEGIGHRHLATRARMRRP